MSLIPNIKKLILKVIIFIVFILLLTFILDLLPVQQFITGINMSNFWVKIIFTALGAFISVIILAHLSE